MVTEKRDKEEEEIEINLAGDALDGTNDDQMDQLLAMIKIVQERVSRIDKKLQEKIEPRRSSGGENQNSKQDVEVVDNGRKPERMDPDWRICIRRCPLKRKGSC